MIQAKKIVLHLHAVLRSSEKRISILMGEAESWQEHRKHHTVKMEKAEP